MVYCANHLGLNAPEPPSVIVPENISPSRLDLLRQLGAHVIFSPAENYSAGYVAVLESILQEDKKRKGGHAGTNPERLVAITKIRHSARESFYALAEEVLQQLGPLEVLPLSAFCRAVGSGVKHQAERLRLLRFDTDSFGSWRRNQYGRRLH